VKKEVFAGKWDTSVGGHITPGEKVEDALKRETDEELGLKVVKFQFITKYIWESLRERELVYSFTGSSVEVPEINKEEIEEGRFWMISEIRENIGRNIFTPNFEHEFNTIIIYLKGF